MPKVKADGPPSVAADQVIAVPEYPSLFMLDGPDTNLGHHSIALVMECQINQILKCMTALRSRGRVTSIWPYSTVTFRWRTLRPRLDDCRMT
ncbi:MAG: hypothetical protein ACREEE_06905 [Dongiaceae bacterium]